MKILAFDQATKISGWAAFNEDQYVDSGVIDLHKNLDTEARTKQMGIELCKKIDEVKPDYIIIEEVQNQSNVATVIKLARLQGMVLGFAAAHKIQTKIFEPSHWRKILSYRQGAKVKRETLKQQSIDYVKNKFGFDFSEDRAEAVCINVAAQIELKSSQDIDIEI